MRLFQFVKGQPNKETKVRKKFKNTEKNVMVTQSVINDQDR